MSHPSPHQIINRKKDAEIHLTLTGIENLSLDPGMILYYKKIIDLSKLEDNGRFLLHFGAVDQTATLYINNKYVGEHDGGYHPFYFDITNYIIDITKIESKRKSQCIGLFYFLIIIVFFL